MAICGERQPERIWSKWEQARADIGSPALIDGNPCLYEIEWLCRIAKLLQAQDAFEIGTFTGVTAQALAGAVTGKVWTLDLPPGAATRWELAAYDRSFVGRRKVSLPENVVQLWGDSGTFDFEPFREACDLVFVDGAHSVEYSRNDLQATLGMRAEGGVIMWHVDDLGREPGPWPIADEFDFLHLAGSRLWLVGETGEFQGRH